MSRRAGIVRAWSAPCLVWRRTEFGMDRGNRAESNQGRNCENYDPQPCGLFPGVWDGNLQAGSVTTGFAKRIAANHRKVCLLLPGRLDLLARERHDLQTPLRRLPHHGHDVVVIDEAARPRDLGV